jgi:amidohydrolase
VRVLDENIRSSIRGILEAYLRDITSSRDGGFELDYIQGYPVTVNDGAMTDLVMSIAAGIVDKANVIWMPPAMASEDMSFYLKEVPGCFFFLGAGSADPALNQPHHNPYFSIDERALEVGVKMLAAIAIDFLENY